MKGFKGMRRDMTCRGMQYKMGENHHIDGEIELGKRGFHFCEKLVDVFRYYDPFEEGNRFFEVETSGLCAFDKKKAVTSDMKVVRELTNKEVNRCYYSEAFEYSDANLNFMSGNGYGDGHDNGDGRGNGLGWGLSCGENGDGNCFGTAHDWYGVGYENIHKILIFK